jgi:hypothetical protein
MADLRHFGAKPAGYAIVKPDTKHIIRQWDREIEDETRRAVARKDEGPWRAVVWGGLWLLWLGLVFGFIGLLRPLH